MNVFRFTGAVGRRSGHSAFDLGALDGEGFGHGTDLVHLDEDGVRDAGLDAFIENRRIRHEQIVADEVDLAAEFVSKDGPALPVPSSRPSSMEKIGNFLMSFS